MPKNKMNDPITDQEMTFARLILSGTMTDRRAAEAAGINPDSAAYIKARPHVRAYMLEHRAAVQQQLIQQEAEGQHRLKLDRDQVLARLWEIANLSPEMTRGSITGQVKALSMIVAMQNFIPNPLTAPLAVHAEKNPPAPPTQQAHQENVPPEPPFVPPSEEGTPPEDDHSHPTSATQADPSQSKPPSSYVPLLTSVPDARAPFSPNKNPFARRR